MISKEEARELKILAKQIQIETIKCIESIGQGHLGGSLSIADVLAVLYGKQMKYDAKNPDWDGRDYLVLSKGHAGPALYAALALQGFFDPKMLMTLNRPETRLPSHADRNLTPGVDMTCGSLGQGGSVAAGIALDLKLCNKDNIVYAIMGDGEIEEGQVWEMALFAAAKKLNNLIVFIDRNYYQIDGTTEQVCSLGDIAAKFEQFGWFTQTVDGHEPEAISNAVDAAKQLNSDKPAVIVLKTIKGNGWSKSENQLLSHFRGLTQEEACEAIAEMSETIRTLEEGG